VKLLNASKFVLGFPTAAAGEVTEPVDRAMLAALADVVASATEAFESYDYARALERSETFFWTFCDDYIELVKNRAYGEGPAAESAARALRLALDTLLRLFAPFLAFAAEEVWSWWRDGSVHLQAWPVAADIRAAGGEHGDIAVLTAAADVLAQIRKAKSTAKVTMKTPVTSLRVGGAEPLLAQLSLAQGDVANAGVVETFELVPGDADFVEVTLGEPPAKQA
jgi:valyl-tRNA synthetase